MSYLKIFGSVIILALVSILSISGLNSTLLMPQQTIPAEDTKDTDDFDRVQVLHNELGETNDTPDTETEQLVEDSERQEQVQASSDDIARLQEEIKNLRSEKEHLQEQIQEQENMKRANENTSGETAEEGGSDLSPSSSQLFEAEEICSYFPTSSFTASEIWQKHLDRIFLASHNPEMPPEVSIHNNTQEADQMHKLLRQTIPPSRMRKGLLHMPTLDSTHQIVKNVVQIIQNRIKDPANNPPLKIAVFGGSVTIGRACYMEKEIQNKQCAWPTRFKLLINQFLGMDVVEVYNLGIGGTNSDTATRMVDYWMYPDELKQEGPDVIINSYSTNDASPPWDMTEDADSGYVVANVVRVRVQEFIRTALSSRPCSIPPLVVNVDDYLGPLHNSILGELSYKTTLTQLAKWYDTVAISYAEVVRDIAYANTADKTFFNEKDVHFGYWAHQTIAWSVGFGSLELLSQYCDDEYRMRSIVAKEEKSKGEGTGDGLDSGKDIDHQNHEFFVPPRLTEELLLTNATVEFNAAKEATALDNSKCPTLGASGEADDGETEYSKDKSPCAIAWISSPGLFDGSQIQRFMMRYAIDIQGWQTETNLKNGGWTNKVGWIATGPNATFTLALNDMDKDVSSVTIFYMKSYGDKWADSKARFTVSIETDEKGDGEEKEVNESILLQEDIWGVHNSTTSLTFLEKFALTESVPKGQPMKMKVDLISGSTFKLMGLMLCRY